MCASIATVRCKLFFFIGWSIRSHDHFCFGSYCLDKCFFCQKVSYRTIWGLRCRTITILCQVMDGLPFSLFTSFDVYVDVVVAASTRHASHATNQNVWMYHTLPFHWVVQQLMSTNDNDWPFYVFDPIEALFTYFTFCFYAPKIKDIQLSTNYRCY